MSTAEHSSRSLQCVVVTPERAVLDEPVDFVALPMYDGELGVLPGRLPLIGRLGFGELRLARSNHVERYYVDGGFTEVRDDVVTVLTQRAIAAGDIRVEAAREVLTHPPHGHAAESQEAYQRQQQRARAQIRIAGKGQ